MSVDKFSEYLHNKGYANNTVRSYCYTMRDYFEHYDGINANELNDYIRSLHGKYSGSTINLRIAAINSYLRFIDIDIASIKHLKSQRNMYLENVISTEEFELLKRNLQADSQWTLYYLVRFMGSTGMRISEVLELKIEDIQNGYFDICSKGNKERRVFIPSSLAIEAMNWLTSIRRYSGYVFLSKSGNHLSASGARYLLSYYAAKYGIEKAHAHPHALRHRFALNFLNARQDISLLSDLLGHSNIETTRIYLRQSRNEQKKIIDTIVNW